MAVDSAAGMLLNRPTAVFPIAPRELPTTPSCCWMLSRSMSPASESKAWMMTSPPGICPSPARPSLMRPVTKAPASERPSEMPVLSWVRKL